MKVVYYMQQSHSNLHTECCAKEVDEKVGRSIHQELTQGVSMQLCE